MDGHTRQSEAGHETRDAPIKPIVLTGAGLAIVVAIVGMLAYGIYQYLGAHPGARFQANPMSSADSQIPPEPRIEEHPALGIQQLHSQEEHTLSTYGWIDKQKGVVRIPIDRAMELQLERGFPTRREPVKK